MSERSELHQHGAFFAEKRRSAHWCQAIEAALKASDDGMVHQ